MHWIKLLAEVWLLFGVVTVVLGLYWTSRMSTKTQHDTIRSFVPSHACGDLVSVNLTKISA